MGYFDLARLGNFPTQYAEVKTAVTVDVLEVGLILAFVIVGVAFLIAVLGFSIIRCSAAAAKIICSIIIGCLLMLGNFGQEWEVGSVKSAVPYRAGSPHQVNASIGIKLGLRSINITLRANTDNTPLEGEIINYNERFSWTWDQGRFGFGPYAGLLQRSFREAQRKGLPIPILSIMEYLVVDGEGLRYGRFYRTAGWYTHILMWTAFATWIVTNIFLVKSGCYAAYFLALTGALQILACIVWSSVRNPYPLVIPFEHGEITTSYGSNFWMALVCGLMCLLFAAVMFVMDLWFTEELSSFLGLDSIDDFDDCVLSANEVELLRQEIGGKTNNMEMQRLTIQMDGHDQASTRVLKRRSSVAIARKNRYRLPPPVPIRETYDNEDPIYANTANQPGVSMQGVTNHSREMLYLPSMQ
ncbi:dual oxidase maturation factor 1-like [Neodiprion pinetum]|uniref:dual oxidase maturation factor 1-like n=1 Tax=Neodiprion pinetum TaxID=441929 RepID=UPI001EDD351B|nr:dual oxidase maturation factor 1-like [Neodiprion pinetum]XP_046467435.1 dual oxidase maturation factor 1-like [Neodiprion pinetum]XP_046467437.1 dual oxidase maturation factor 1-like [Neodiprion pinetum]